MDFLVLADPGVQWIDGRYFRKGEFAHFPVDPCRPDLFEGSEATQEQANEKAELIKKVVAAKIMPPSTAERCSIEKLKTALAEGKKTKAPTPPVSPQAGTLEPDPEPAEDLDDLDAGEEGEEDEETPGLNLKELQDMAVALGVPKEDAFQMDEEKLTTAIASLS